MESTNRGSSDEQRATGRNGPRVSVICPFYQAERYLDETIRSVLAQRFDDFEFLLVDDGSTDSGASIVKDHAARDARIHYLEHPEHSNRGACASRNLALTRARADLVAFIDADDCWRPAKLAEQVALLDRMPDVDAVCGAVNFWSSHAGGEDQVIPTGHTFNRPVRPPEGLVKVYPLGRADPPCPSDLLMRRSIVERLGGFEEAFTGPLQMYEDQAFLAKFFLEGTIYFSDRVWLDYRVHDRSCTMSAIRDGLQPQVRRHCLEWFEAYLAASRWHGNLRARIALMRALRQYRHPHVFRLERLLKALIRQLFGRRAVPGA